MAGPAFISAGTRAQSASAATLTPSLPTVISGGNGLLVCIVDSKNNAVHSTATTGWTKLGQTDSGAGFTSSVFVAFQGVAAPVVTWTGAAACAAQISYYADGQGVADGIGASVSVAGTTATHTSTAITSTRPDSLFVYIDVAAANTALATPSGWTGDVDGGSSTDAGRTSFGSKSAGASGTSSGAISVTGANAAWVQWQLELRNTDSGPLAVSKAEADIWQAPARNSLAASKAEADIWQAPPGNSLAVPKAEAALWLVPNDDQNRYSKLEVDLWLTAPSRRPHLMISVF